MVTQTTTTLNVARQSFAPEQDSFTGTITVRGGTAVLKPNVKQTAADSSGQAGQIASASCIPGSYGPACRPCPMGKFMPRSNATAARGKRILEGDIPAATCQTCRAGSYANKTGSTECKLCDKGRYNIPNKKTALASVVLG
jgi:hypothetical protein